VEDPDALALQDSECLARVAVSRSVVYDYQFDVRLRTQRLNRLVDRRTVVVTGDEHCDAGSGVRFCHEFGLDASPAKARGSLPVEASPQVDLVVPTLGRSEELERLLESLVAQSYPGLRVVLVDQNADDRLAPVVSRFDSHLSIVRVESPPGLSRARNRALPLLTGDIVAFPDDDCWYPPSLLHAIAGALVAHADWDGLSVQVRDSRGQRSSMLWDTSPGPIDRYNVWRRAISVGFFLRRSTITAVGEFAEELGLGAGTPWASGEESDYLLHALESGFTIYYEPSLFVHHESPRLLGGDVERRAAHARGFGHGEVLRRHRYPLWFVAYRVLQLVAGSAAFLLRGRVADARYYLAMALGRARGWLDSAS
jgi:glycosyltransferase involved in cell wall biosynthesis